MLFVLNRSRVTCAHSWVTTHVTRLPTSTNNIEWLLYRKLHTHSWVKTQLVRSRVTCVFTHEWVCNCLYRSHSMLFVLVRSVLHVLLLMNECIIVYRCVILCCSCSLGTKLHVFLFMKEWLLYRQLHTHSWVKTHVSRLLISTNNIEWHLYKQLHPRWSRVTCVFTHEWVCNCLYRSHSMLFVLVRSRVTCVFLINECVIVYACVILCCSWLLLISTNNIEWHLYRQLHTRWWVTTHVTRHPTSTNSIEWLLNRPLGAKLHVLLLMKECVIVYSVVILCCSCSLGAVLHVLLLMNECVIFYRDVILC
jgi:hypothetical protein